MVLPSNKKVGSNRFLNVPEKVVEHILDFLRVEDLRCTEKVCVRFKKVTEEIVKKRAEEIKVQQLEEKKNNEKVQWMEELKEEKACLQCVKCKKQKQVLFLPCKHLLYCLACSDVEKCSKCGEKVKSKMEVKWKAEAEGVTELPSSQDLHSMAQMLRKNVGQRSSGVAGKSAKLADDEKFTVVEEMLQKRISRSNLPPADHPKDSTSSSTPSSLSSASKAPLGSPILSHSTSGSSSPVLSKARDSEKVENSPDSKRGRQSVDSNGDSSINSTKLGAFEDSFDKGLDKTTVEGKNIRKAFSFNGGKAKISKKDAKEAKDTKEADKKKKSKEPNKIKKKKK